MSDLESLDPELRELFARESGAYPEDLAARDAVLRRLQAAILLAPLATSGAAAAGASAAGAAGGAVGKATGGAVMGWKGAAVVAAVSFAGGVGAGEARHALSHAPVVESARPVSIAPATPPPSSSVSAITEPVPGAAVSASPAHSPASVAVSSSVPPPSTATTSDIAAERALIDMARTALARGLASDALSATELHAKRFVRGRLAEEREAIAVQALVSKGDANAARARADRFRRTFPDSIFRAAVDSAVASLEERKVTP